MGEVLIRCSLGLFTSLVVGSWVTAFFLRRVRRRLDRLRGLRGDSVPAPWHGVQDVPPGLTGVIERLFFTVVVAFNVPGAVVAMIAWLAVKMATDWNRPGTPTTAAGAMSALLGGMVSMLFAVAGGLICSGIFIP
jgi:hypothetical protein